MKQLASSLVELGHAIAGALPYGAADDGVPEAGSRDLRGGGRMDHLVPEWIDRGESFAEGVEVPPGCPGGNRAPEWLQPPRSWSG